MHDKTFATDFAHEAARGTVSLGVAAASSWSMNDVLIAVSIVLILLQIVYLGWKWRREKRQADEDDAGEHDHDDAFAELVERLAAKHQADKDL